MFLESLNLKGLVKAQLFDCRGALKWEDEVRNLIVNQGKNDILDTYFNAGTQITTMYIGLIDNSGFSAIDASDTHASHAGWTENEDYNEATRVLWNPGAAAGEAVVNASARDFTMNATAAINGIFIAETSTKGSTAATILWAATSFGTVVNVVNTDVIQITYTVSA